MAMVRAVFVGVLAAASFVGPAMALAQTTDMVTYGDTMRKKSGSHSAIRPVTRGSVSSKRAAGAKRAVSAKRTASAKASGGKTSHGKTSGAKHASAKGKHHK